MAVFSFVSMDISESDIPQFDDDAGDDAEYVRQLVIDGAVKPLAWDEVPTLAAANAAERIIPPVPVEPVRLTEGVRNFLV
jgi:hypothetical protein